MALMLNLTAMPWFSSVLSFATPALPASSSATSSIMGPMRLQGPHQGAQQSTIAMLLDSTKESKFDSLSSVTMLSAPVSADSVISVSDGAGNFPPGAPVEKDCHLLQLDRSCLSISVRYGYSPRMAAMQSRSSP